MSYVPATEMPVPPPKKGMSGGMKFLLGCGLTFGLLSLLCCGGVGYLSYSIYNSSSVDPLRVQQIANQIVAFRLPAPFKPSIGYDGWMPRLGYLAGAIYSSQGQPAAGLRPAAGNCAVAEFEEGRLDETEMQDIVIEFIAMQGVEKPNVKFTPVKTVPRSVNGKPGKFIISEGFDDNSQLTMLQLFGSFRSKSDKPAVMVLWLDASHDQAELEEVIKSVH